MKLQEFSVFTNGNEQQEENLQNMFFECGIAWGGCRVGEHLDVDIYDYITYGHCNGNDIKHGGACFGESLTYKQAMTLLKQYKKSLEKKVDFEELYENVKILNENLQKMMLKQNKSIKGIKDERCELRQLNKSLAIGNGELRNLISNLRSDLSNSSMAISVYKDIERRHLDVIQLLNCRIETVKNHNAKLVEQNDELKLMNKRLSKINKTVQNKCDSVERRIDVMNESRDKLQCENECLREQNNELKKQIINDLTSGDGWEQSKDDTDFEVTITEHEKMLKQTIAELEITLGESRIRCGELLKHNGILFDNVKTQSDEAYRFQNENVRLQDKIDEIESSLENCRTHRHHLTKENRFINAKLEPSPCKITASKYEEIINNLNMQIKHDCVIANKMNIMVGDRNETIRLLQTKISSLTCKLNKQYSQI